LAALWAGLAAPVGLYAASAYPYYSSAYSVPKAFAHVNGPKPGNDEKIGLS
jgi:hypothetical protein